MGSLKKKRRLKMNKHKRRKRSKENRHKKRLWGWLTSSSERSGRLERPPGSFSGLPRPRPFPNL